MFKYHCLLNADLLASEHSGGSTLWAHAVLALASQSVSYWVWFGVTEGRLEYCTYIVRQRNEL